VLAWTLGHFRKLGIATARLDAELLLAHAIGRTRIDLYVEHLRPLDPDERDRYRAYVKRRTAREPVAYIIGSREFFSLEFEVGPAVLVPRPETEHVVEAALARLDIDGVEERVLDLGTGSGNIAIAIAKERSSVRIDAVDTSPRAIEVADRNALRHGVGNRVRWLVGDLFEALDPGSRYQIIASNPPYIRADEFEGLSPDVRRHEPRAALVDEKSPTGDGLGYFREIARRAGEFLTPNGAVIVEIGEGQAAQVSALFEAAGFREIERSKDYGGIERVISASARSSS
jgi:release factor glutamine methyltransferase